MSIYGDNFVKLVGVVQRKKVTTYDNGGVLFKCSLAVPTPPAYTESQYISVSVWGDKAESLGEVPNGTWIKITGHLEKNSFNTNCKYCQGPSKVYWMTVVIDNYVLLGDQKNG